MAVLGLASCQSEEVVENPSDKEMISFAVTSGNPSRAEQSFCNTSKPEQITVKALVNGVGTEYFNETLTTTDGGKNYSTEKAQYWPATAGLDFYAWVNGEGTIADGALKFASFTVADAVAEQKDLIFAVNKNVTKATSTNGAVTLNFRHALSQVVFQAYNETSYTIEVSGVSVGHLQNSGSFSFTEDNTNVNYENHEGTKKDTDPSYKNGTWTLTEPASYKQYDIALDATSLANTSKESPKVLTSVDHEGKQDNSLILMPQKQKAWDPADTKSSEFNGAYFLLKVKITNEKGTLVYGSEEGEAADAAIPVDIDWKPGVRYIYTFHFKDGGTGGYTPTPNDPKPVLTNITYTVTTDDFVPADNEDVLMDKVAK